MADKVHKEFSIRVPNTGEIKALSRRMGFDLTEEEISSYKDFMSGALRHTYQRLYELPDSKRPVKYPRTPGYRPSPRENPYNAWYWRCDIPGAPAGKLHGKTLAIKDSICVAGVPLMCGSRMLEGYVPDNDATVVSRILDAGGKIIGKAVCEEFCFTATSYTSATGPVVNPHDQTRMALGSSSGSAALVAGGLVDMAMGGDQGGSIRIPAAACGIVGLKPTYGLVPYTGIISGGFLLDHTGPMARTVFDVSLLLEVVAGFDGGLDPRQPRDLNISNSYTSQLTGDISGLRIAVLQEGFQMPEADDDISRLVRESVDRLATIGAIIEEVSIPMHCDGNGIGDVLCVEGGYRLLRGVTPGARGFVDTSLESAISRGFQTYANALSAPGKLMLTAATFIHETYNGYFFGKAINLADRLCEEYDIVFKSYDVLVLPTITTKPPKVPMENENIFETAFSFCQNTAPFNVTGHPALSINAGFSDGLPVGIMVVGRKFQDATVLNVGYAYEKIRDTK